MHKATGRPHKDIPLEATKQAVVKALRLGALHKFQLIPHLPNPVPTHYAALRVALKELQEDGLIGTKGERINTVYYLTLPSSKEIA